MWAFIVAIIVFVLTQVISILVLFRYGMIDNQSLAPSTAARKTSTIGTLIALAIAATDWLLPYGPDTPPLAIRVETPQAGSRRFPQNAYKGRLPMNERQLGHRRPENAKPRPDVRSG
jgi:hypothetical protein